MDINRAIDVDVILLGIPILKGNQDVIEALKLSIDALSLFQKADLSGGVHTFKGKSVEECIFIRMADLKATLLGKSLLGG